MIIIMCLIKFFSSFIVDGRNSRFFEQRLKRSLVSCCCRRTVFLSCDMIHTVNQCVTLTLSDVTLCYLSIFFWQPISTAFVSSLFAVFSLYDCEDPSSCMWKSSWMFCASTLCSSPKCTKWWSGVKDKRRDTMEWWLLIRLLLNVFTTCYVFTAAAAVDISFMSAATIGTTCVNFCLLCSTFFSSSVSLSFSYYTYYTLWQR